MLPKVKDIIESEIIERYGHKLTPKEMIDISNDVLQKNLHLINKDEDYSKSLANLANAKKVIFEFFDR